MLEAGGRTAHFIERHLRGLPLLKVETTAYATSRHFSHAIPPPPATHPTPTTTSTLHSHFITTCKGAFRAAVHHHFTSQGIRPRAGGVDMGGPGRSKVMTHHPTWIDHCNSTSRPIDMGLGLKDAAFQKVVDGPVALGLWSVAPP